MFFFFFMRGKILQHPRGKGQLINPGLKKLTLCPTTLHLRSSCLFGLVFFGGWLYGSFPMRGHEVLGGKTPTVG